MDNNEKSQSWTDPITGEVYPSGNPHVSIQKSVAVDPSIKVRSFRDQDPPEQEVYPQQAQPTPQVQVVQPGQRVQTTVRRTQTTVQQVNVYDPNGIIPQIVERPQRGATVSHDNVTKFCEHCGGVIAKGAVVCPLCGCQVAALQQMQAQPIQQNVIINNNLQQQGNVKDKWVAFFLCLFFGVFGAHRFYEGRTGTGLLYLFTIGLFGIGWFVDIIRILCSPDQYYV